MFDKYCSFLPNEITHFILTSKRKMYTVLSTWNFKLEMLDDRCTTGKKSINIRARMNVRAVSRMYRRDLLKQIIINSMLSNASKMYDMFQLWKPTCPACSKYFEVSLLKSKNRKEVSLYIEAYSGFAKNGLVDVRYSFSQEFCTFIQGCAYVFFFGRSTWETIGAFR